MGKEDLFGKARIQKRSYDKIVAIICSFNLKSEQPLLKFLSTLFSSNIDLDEKKRILREKYSITMDEEMEEVSNRMCNLSEGIFWDGFDQGKIEGKIEGKTEGKTEGEIIGTIKTLKKFNIEPQEIYEMVIREFNVTPEMVKNCIRETLQLPKEFVFNEPGKAETV